MKHEEKGWVVVNFDNPAGKPFYAVHSTFSSRKRDAIQKFCKESGADWMYWSREHKFKCVKALSTISTL